MRRLGFVLMLLVALGLVGSAQVKTPQQLVDEISTNVALLFGYTHTPVVRVPVGGNLQAALDAAQPGDTIALAPGVYTGNFVLRAKAGAGTITLRSDVPDSALPAPGQRLTPTTATGLAKLAGLDPYAPVVRTEDAAHGYRLLGLEVSAGAMLPDRDLLVLGALNMKTLAQVPYDIELDRVYIHGDPIKGGHRGISFNARNGTLRNSWLSDFAELGRDSQAVLVGNGPGPYLFDNNFMSATGEDMLIGGVDPSIPGLVPADIVVRGSHFYKPPAWRTAWPGSVKNNFELKNAIRVLLTGNVFENTWASGQAGSNVVFTPRNQDGTAPWCTVRDVTFEYNQIISGENFALNLTGVDYDHPSTPGGNYVIRHNLVRKSPKFIQTGGFVAGLDVSHNTVLDLTGQVFLFGSLTTGLNVHDNVAVSGEYGISGDGSSGMGVPSLVKMAPGYVWGANVIEGTAVRTIPWPPLTTLLAPGGLAALLDATLQYTGPLAADGLPMGADMATLKAKTAGAVVGR